MTYCIKVHVGDYDDDWTFTKEGKPVPEGTILHAQGDSPKAALEAFNATYKVCNRGGAEASYNHPVWVKNLFETVLVKDLAKKKPKEFYPSNNGWVYYLSGNWDVTVTIEEGDVDAEIRYRGLLSTDGFSDDSDFKASALKAYGVADNPKADMAFNLAWQYGHHAGYHEVDNYFSEIVDLIK